MDDFFNYNIMGWKKIIPIIFETKFFYKRRYIYIYIYMHTYILHLLNGH